MKEDKIMNEVNDNSNNIFSTIVKNKKVAICSFITGALIGGGTVALFSFTPRYSLCRTTNNNLHCHRGTQCIDPETKLQGDLTLSQCRAKGGS